MIYGIYLSGSGHPIKVGALPKELSQLSGRAFD